MERGPTSRVMDDPQHDYTRLLRACVPRPGVEAPPARCCRDLAGLKGLDTQVGFGDEPVAVELRGEPALVGA